MDLGPALNLTQMHELLGAVELRATGSDGRPSAEAFVRLTQAEILGLRRTANLILQLTPHADRVRDMISPRQRRSR
ncbi:MAG: hypothetical protein JWM36_3190 [Hyphomicrobiales bacterium]|nr:hypothetical protein [Hyphomicrobiales bacterium]